MTSITVIDKFMVKLWGLYLTIFNLSIFKHRLMYML